MASVTPTVPETETTETETETEKEATRIIGVVPAQDSKVPFSRKPPDWNERIDRLVGATPRTLTRKEALARRWRQCLAWFDPDYLPIGEPLSGRQLERIQRKRRPGYFRRLAMDRQITSDCLCYYNLNHPDDQYEPAAGMVYENTHFHNGVFWTHGNFVARKKRSGCFSFLPAPRTLFFFELSHTREFDGVVTCTPLDEPVTESYSVLGFPLGFSTRRSGKLDSFCKTCYKRFDLPYPDMQKTFACGHQHVQIVCEMCYLFSSVLHPCPQASCPDVFAFGYRPPYHPYPTKH